MDILKVTIALTLAVAVVVGFILTFVGNRFAKLGGSCGAIIATAATAFFACRPLTGAYPNWPTTDAVYRAAWAAIPVAILAIAFILMRVPFWLRGTLTLLATLGLLLWIFLLYPAPEDTTHAKFVLEWAGTTSVIVLSLWVVTEWIAIRSPGVATPLVIGFVYAGIGALNLMSSSTKSGNLIGAAGAVVAGALIACMLTKRVSLSNGPVFAWLTLLSLLYVPSCYDADAIPTRPLLFVLGSPLLALLIEIAPLKKSQPWKRESMRALLLAIPVGIGIFLGYQQMKANGDGDVMRHPVAPTCPSQMPIANTINPPTIT